MMGISLGHLIILLVIILLFGGKRLPELGGALGKGLRSFKQGLEGRIEEDKDGKPRVDGPNPGHANADQDSDIKKS